MKMIALTVLIVNLLAACQTSQSTQTNPNSRAASTGTDNQPAPTQLNDIWALRQLNGKPFDKSQSPRQHPYIEINLRDGRVVGSTGCNRLSGAMQVTATTLKFGPLMTTKMACTTDTAVESDFLKALKSADTYKLDGLTLTLFQGTTELMTLGKGD